jgi:hypothetical protein
VLDHQFEFGLDPRNQIDVVVIKVFQGAEYPAYIGQATVETQAKRYTDPGLMHLPLLTVDNGLNLLGDEHAVGSAAQEHVIQARLGQDGAVDATLEVTLLHTTRAPKHCIDHKDD